MLMCMCMLTKRAQILFDDREWLMLRTAAQMKGVSIGKLVREAVNRTYQKKLKRSPSVVAALEHIKKIRPEPFKGKIDYEELINYGRKY